MRIAFIDDEPDYVYLIKQRLLDFEVDYYNDSEIDDILFKNYDVIVCDHYLSNGMSHDVYKAAYAAGFSGLFIVHSAARASTVLKDCIDANAMDITIVEKGRTDLLCNILYDRMNLVS